MPTPIFGLTGGIGCGKSFVAQVFGELGIQVIDVDRLARDLVARGEPALEAIRAHFGDAVLLPNGELDRRQLRQIVFADSGAKLWLEQLLHPRVRERLIALLDQAPGPYCVLESPLLLETDQHQMVEGIIVVDLDENTQIARASQRDNSDAEQIRRIIANQIPREQRLQRADWVIDNSGGPTQTRAQVLALHTELLTRLKG